MSRMEIAQKQYERNVPICDFIMTKEGFDCVPDTRKSNPADDLKADLGESVKGSFVSMLTDTPAEFLGLALGMGSFQRAWKETKKTEP